MPVKISGSGGRRLVALPQSAMDQQEQLKQCADVHTEDDDVSAAASDIYVLIMMIWPPLTTYSV